MRVILAVVWMLLAAGATAQDLVVTPEGDSLNCKITRIKNQQIYFVFKYKGETRTTLIPVAEVRGYQYGFYKDREVDVETDKSPMLGDYSKFRFAVGGGWSYRTASLPDGAGTAERDYLRELKSGYGLTAQAAWFISETVGIGALYAGHRSKVSKSSVTLSSNGSVYYTGPLRDDVSIRFIAPVLVTRLVQANKKGVGLFDFSLGYLGYKDVSTMSSNFFRIEGATLGLATGLGYDILLSEHVGIGLNVALITGTLSQVKLIRGSSSTTIKLDKDEYENLTRVEITAGIRLLR
jgi:hypothetical protein